MLEARISLDHCGALNVNQHRYHRCTGIMLDTRFLDDLNRLLQELGAERFAGYLRIALSVRLHVYNEKIDELLLKTFCSTLPFESRVDGACCGQSHHRSNNTRGGKVHDQSCFSFASFQAGGGKT